ncbi:MAG: response regulator, partial [Chloroflexi bacterium]|nr:response regulator [Chloroflexota bacterium]
MEQRTNPRESAGILIVDDTPANLQLLEGMLRQHGYEPRPVPSGRMALQAARIDPPDLILLDINMPGMNGYEVCHRLKTDPQLKDIPVLFISAMDEMPDKVEAFAAGGVDYITKPFQFAEVQARVDVHLKLRRLQLELERHNSHLQELVAEQVKEISDLQMATIFALAKLSESRDDETGRHLERVQSFCRLLAQQLRENSGPQGEIDEAFIEDIFRASPLHDIGKVGIPDAILLKPGKLTTEEFEVMKGHALIGAQTLEAVQERSPHNAFIKMGIEISRSHHERWDGRGYPDGLAGEEIPLAARVMALADVYDALRSKRIYKSALPHPQCQRILLEESDGHFDPAVAAAFETLEEEFRRTWERLAG